MPTDIEPLLPGPAARGDGVAYAEAVWSGMRTNEECAESIRDGLHSLDVAVGPVLDQSGDWVSEGRDGLEDAPYRRIIAGARVRAAGGVTPPAIVRGWRQVTGDCEAIMDEATSEVHLYAQVPYVVDTAWLARAAEITRGTVGNGRVLYALIASPGTFVLGLSSFDTHGFAADFTGP